MLSIVLLILFITSTMLGTACVIWLMALLFSKNKRIYEPTDSQQENVLIALRKFSDFLDDASDEEIEKVIKQYRDVK